MLRCTRAIKRYPQTNLTQATHQLPLEWTPTTPQNNQWDQECQQVTIIIIITNLYKSVLPSPTWLKLQALTRKPANFIPYRWLCKSTTIQSTSCIPFSSTTNVRCTSTSEYAYNYDNGMMHEICQLHCNDGMLHAYISILMFNMQVVQQQTSNNVVVVNSQPTTVPTTVHVTRNDQSAFIFAIVVTLILFFCGCWWSFACTIPAMVLGSMVSGSHF